jgi:predicted GTPase
MQLRLKMAPVGRFNQRFLKYLKVMAYFISKYALDEPLVAAFFDLYKNALLPNRAGDFHADATEIKNIIKSVGATKFKWLRIFSHRYSLVCDLCVLAAVSGASDGRPVAERMFAEVCAVWPKRYARKLEILFKILYDETAYSDEYHSVKYQIDCWKSNRDFLALPEKRVLVTANMSAGKSTLINALIGKTANRMMNEACTAKVHYLFDKAFEDGYTYERDYVYNLNADYHTLMDDDERNETEKIYVATRFSTLVDRDCRLCLIDTPGVNASTDSRHGELTRETIDNEKYDFILFVLNGEALGINDDHQYLSHIAENVPHEKVIFVLNKLDKFRISEDSVSESVERLKSELISLGFENPNICPFSALLSVYVKKKLDGVPLSEDEQDELELLEKKFTKPAFDLSRYYPAFSRAVTRENNSKYLELVKKCGLLGLEQILF